MTTSEIVEREREQKARKAEEREQRRRKKAEAAEPTAATDENEAASAQSPEQKAAAWRSLPRRRTRPPSLPPPPTIHQRHSDRSSGDDSGSGDVLGRTQLPVFVRFRDLRAAGICDNWTQVFRLIEDYGFPSGVLLSPNIRAWDVDAIRRWLENRPTERKIIAPPRKHAAI
jgi:hypothetical protein